LPFEVVDSGEGLRMCERQILRIAAHHSSRRSALSFVSIGFWREPPVTSESSNAKAFERIKAGHIAQVPCDIDAGSAVAAAARPPHSARAAACRAMAGWQR
jgi:hypothetical protein